MEGETKTKIYCQVTLCQRCILSALRTVKLGLTNVGNQAKSLNYSEKGCTSHYFRADVHTYWPLTSTQCNRRRSWDWHVRMSTLSHTYCGKLRESIVVKNLTNVCTVVKSTSTWSASPGLNLPTSLGVCCSVWQWQESTEDLSWVFSEHSVSRLSYVCFCRLSPLRNWNICSEQAQHRPRTISSHAAILWGYFKAFWEESLHKHPRSWSRSWCGSSCVECCTSAECAGSTTPQLSSSRPICSLVCAPGYTEARLSSNGVVHGWGLLHQRKDFQQPQQPYLGRRKPSCCICSLPPTMLCDQCLGKYC